MSKLSIKGILEKLDKLKKSNPHRYMINGSKNCRILTPWSGPLAMGQKKQHCNNFYRLVFIRLTLFFQAQFGLISRIIVLREFISVFHKETEKKKHFVTFHTTLFSFLRIWSHLLKKSIMENFIFLCCVMATVAKRKICFINNNNLVDSNHY